jgi:outer membrane protein TolC
VKASFGGVLLAQEMSGLAKQSLELAEAHLKNVEQLYKQGVASEYELIRARVQVAQLVPASIKADNELDRALIVFRNTLGLSADERVGPEGELERKPVVTSVEEAFAQAKQKRNDIAAAQLRVQGMKAALDVAKADRYPSLSFVGNANMQTDEPRLKSEDWRAKMWSATVDLSFPIFDGLRTKGKIRQTKAEFEQARLLSEQAIDGVRLEVEQAVSKLVEARKLMDSQVASVEQAQKGLDIADIRYKNGVGTQLEVLDAQVSLATARTNHFMSVYEHFMAVAELERATGASFE